MMSEEWRKGITDYYFREKAKQYGWTYIEVRALIDEFARRTRELRQDPRAMSAVLDRLDWKGRGAAKERYESVKNDLIKLLGVTMEEREALALSELERMAAEMGLTVVEPERLEKVRGYQEALEKLREERKRRRLREDEIEKLRKDLETLREEIKRGPPPPTLTDEDVNRLLAEFDLYLRRRGVAFPESYEPDFYKALDRDKSYEDNSKTVRSLADKLVKEIEKLAPPAPPEIEKRLKRLEETVASITAPPRELPPRKYTPATVTDWMDDEPITVDADEIWRLRQLLHYDTHFYNLKPENQRKAYGVDTKDAVKLAIFNERITRNHLLDMGLNPEEYGV